MIVARDARYGNRFIIIYFQVRKISECKCGLFLNVLLRVIFIETSSLSTGSRSLERSFLSNALIIGGAELDANFAKAAQNIPNVDVLPAAGLNVYDVLRRKTLVLTKDALESIDARFNGAKAEA